MEKKFISLTYDLMLKDSDGQLYNYESATRERPFKFITGIGYALDLFESNVGNLNVGDSFQFEVPCAQAYGQYDKENVIELDKGIFLRNGVFDDEHVKIGAIIPLSDGQQTFNATVTNITDDKVTVDLNHPLASMLMSSVIVPTIIVPAKRRTAFALTCTTRKPEKGTYRLEINYTR